MTFIFTSSLLCAIVFLHNFACKERFFFLYMANDNVVLRFNNVTFEYAHNKPILTDVSFSVRRGSKITLMGQNGAGKTTLFGLITEKLTPEEGDIHIDKGLTVAISRQIIPRDELQLTVREFFEKCFSQKVYEIDPKIEAVLEIVNLHAPLDRKIDDFSGGQQARLLLASALIQNPDILLLDEPTNNLDHAGIEHLTEFLKASDKTVLVISHDAEFLNAFSTGVLYLDIYNRKIEQYPGNYNNVLREITARVERERAAAAQAAKKIQENKDKINFFAQKGGNMRKLAAKMRDEVEEMEDEKVSIRKEDRTIRHFKIQAQEDLSGPLLVIKSFTMMKHHEIVERTANIILKKNQHLQLVGPNGIGKTTLLETLAHGRSEGAVITEGIRVGYYRQDFSTLNPEETVYKSLEKVFVGRPIDEELRAVGGGFLLSGAMMETKIKSLSEGQKALVCFAQLVIMKPGILIMDEPTNHVNFRHIPVIAKALHDYEGALVLVSHVPTFVDQVRIDEVFDLDK